MEQQHDSAHLIHVDNVVKTYPTGAGELTVLHGVTLKVKPSEAVGVVGPSGSGKSTLLNMITGIDRPTRGQVVVNGQPLHTFSENQLARWRGLNIGVIFQFFQLLPTLTVIENVMLPMDFCNVYPARERPQRAMAYLEEVDLADQAHKLPNTLSGGQQQRAAIARALANDPPVIVADEPTGNLDTATAESVFSLFDRLVNVDGKTLLIVTHDKSLAARLPRIVEVRDGRLRDNGHH
ncbi:MAG TPA: ABC transporter ATP-binding protein [Anaerolineae bacterium]|nr:ABC transporter ATP-binding protein [Anaerolineae bacterium]